MNKSRILIVDDDKNICRLIDLYLKDAGFETVCCHDGSTAMDIVGEGGIGLVVLDLMIPAINGWEVCKLIKTECSIPVIIVSARDLVDDKIAGFDAGADDYVVKPFDPKELAARVKARLRTASGAGDEGRGNVLAAGNLSVDFDRYEARIDGDIIPLKPKEIQLLHFLLKNKNIVFTRDQLLEKIWGYSYSGDTRTVDVHIKCLREKLECRAKGVEIKTVWGVGYKLETR